ncbi:MAG: DUF3486 family protein [Acetobacter aceti]
MAHRPSSVDRLEPEIREEIGRLRANGHSIDEILAALRELDGAEISRSALGRHVKKLDEVGRRLRHSRTVAEALVRQLGEEPASRTAQLNIELLHTTLLDLFLAADDVKGGADDKGLSALKGNPGGIMQLAKALDHLASASSSNQETRRKLEEQIEKKMRAKAEAGAMAEARKRGLDTATVSAIMAGAFGVKS